MRLTIFNRNSVQGEGTRERKQKNSLTLPIRSTSRSDGDPYNSNHIYESTGLKLCSHQRKRRKELEWKLSIFSSLGEDKINQTKILLYKVRVSIQLFSYLREAAWPWWPHSPIGSIWNLFKENLLLIIIMLWLLLIQMMCNDPTNNVTTPPRLKVQNSEFEFFFFFNAYNYTLLRTTTHWTGNKNVHQKELT